MYQNEWNEFYKDGTYVMSEPSEDVIKFFGRLSKDRNIKKMRALDLGCGNGRNTFYMAKLGLHAFGIEISSKALELALNKRREDNEDNVYPVFMLFDGETIPFEDNYFDFVVCHGVLDHILFEKAIELMKEVKRVLEPNGYALIVVHNYDDSQYGKGKEIEKNTFIIEENCEKGLPQHYFTPSNMYKACLKDFELIEYISKEEYMQIKNIKSSFWVVYLQNGKV